MSPLGRPMTVRASAPSANTNLLRSRRQPSDSHQLPWCECERLPPSCLRGRLSSDGDDSVLQEPGQKKELIVYSERDQAAEVEVWSFTSEDSEPHVLLRRGQDVGLTL